MSRQAEAERNDQALLEAARQVLAESGAHTTVAAIAARAGVGIGSLYRRYRTKEELFQRLSVLALDQYAAAAERGLADPDPWAGLVGFITECVEFGLGALAPVAGSIEVTPEMSAKNWEGDAQGQALVTRAHAAGVLRGDVSYVDIVLLIEQLSRSPLVVQLRQQGHEQLMDAGMQAWRRLVAIAVAGLRAGQVEPLPGQAPGIELFTERWSRE